MDKATLGRFIDIKSKSEKYILGNYSRNEICFEYGVGEYLFDTDGNKYLDFQSGIAVTNLGHSEADIIDALREQADKLFHTSNLFYSEEQANLAEVLIVNSFPGKVFFCNSGTEANEAAFKLARKYAVSKKIENPIILSMKGSFHGRT
ncbi:MAG: aminotransferase class III-fold pyridoxal phosphate-dependent enzyme, partial [Leptospiraceae bacterium]|nr:aminotransferase class III-fold pyridoxal phosphate-dependent enzyme [Leptospiraceae bacterium]